MMFPSPVDLTGRAGRPRRDREIRHSDGPGVGRLASRGNLIRKENPMLEEPRLQLMQLAPEAFRHLIAVERLIGEKIDHTLLHLIKMRASQINGCALCLTMHTVDAIEHGERPERLTCLEAWRESPLYTDVERAALAWAEEITLISVHGASREAYEGVKAHFSEEEIAWLT